MGPRPVTAALNHVLRATPVAMERLARYAGKTAAFHVGPLKFTWTVQTTGEATASIPGVTPDLEVRISPFLLPRLAMHDEAAYREVGMTGDAEFAHEISFLARNLRWDAAEDLSKVVGDVAAQRASGAANATAHWASEAVKRTTAGAAEYWTEESPLIASRVKVEDFTHGVSDLRDAIERLEKRIERLPPGAPPPG
jgi:ubiquinone biosynthesis protein UbiJ